MDRIQRADVILHDALVDDEVLELTLPGTEVVDVGHRSREGLRPVASVDRRVPLMLEEAESGKRVVRLHGGDPFVFGRGGEEVAALSRAGVAWEVVPGVSAVVAAPAAAGVPLTQRGLAKGFTVRTGHDSRGQTQGELPPDQETVVVLMGLRSVDGVVAGLVHEGRSPETPAIAVSRASRREQQIVVATVATIASKIRSAGLRSPTTLIVGEVARQALEQATEGSTDENERELAAAVDAVRAAAGVA